MTDASPHTLLIRCLDAGHTYLSFRWLDDPDNPTLHRPSNVTRKRVLRALDNALITVEPGASTEAATAASISGDMSSPERELALGRDLADLVFPQEVRQKITARGADCRIVVRITPSKLLSRVPFELAVIDHARRLIEFADVTYEPPAAVHVGRARVPQPWCDVDDDAPVAYIVDPVMPAGAGIAQVLDRSREPRSGRRQFERRIAERLHTRNAGVGRIVGRWELSDDLRSGPGRLLYFGHVSSTAAEPGSASIHLSDDKHEWGLAADHHGAHRPLSALDLLLGTSAPHLGPTDTEPPAAEGLGHDIWPMPKRVAIIACEGGVDYRSAETFGLVMAMFNGGAEVVTTTRWILPTDLAFERFGGVPPTPGPTTELALAVDDTHRTADPVAALCDWQRAMLTAWRDDPGPANSPLVWAAAACHVCPPRQIHPPQMMALR